MTNQAVEKLLADAWSEAMFPSTGVSGSPMEVGNPDGSPVDCSSEDAFMRQCCVSLAHWLTDENLLFWLETAKEQQFSYNPIFFDVGRIEYRVKTLATRIRDWKRR